MAGAAGVFDQDRNEAKVGSVAVGRVNSDFERDVAGQEGADMHAARCFNALALRGDCWSIGNLSDDADLHVVDDKYDLVGVTISSSVRGRVSPLCSSMGEILAEIERPQVTAKAPKKTFVGQPIT